MSKTTQHEITSDSIGTSLHTKQPKFQVIVYHNVSKGVIVDISFEDSHDAIAYYNNAITLGYYATLIELN